MRLGSWSITPRVGKVHQEQHLYFPKESRHRELGGVVIVFSPAVICTLTTHISFKPWPPMPKADSTITGCILVRTFKLYLLDPIINHVVIFSTPSLHPIKRSPCEPSHTLERKAPKAEEHSEHISARQHFVKQF